MKKQRIDIWKKKLAWIAEKGGMALLNTHFDYMNFDENKCLLETYPAEHYENFLKHVKQRCAGQCWQALPKSIVQYFFSNLDHLNCCFSENKR